MTDTPARKRARKAWRWRNSEGRMALPGVHCSDVDLPERLIELKFLERGQENDEEAVRDAVIALLDSIVLGSIGRL